MQKVQVAQADEVQTKFFDINDFLTHNEYAVQEKKVTKKALKSVAKEIGLHCSDEEIQAMKKVLQAYLAKG